jgi:hypothetical protein
MSPESRAELRALALWHTRRRVVDELLAPLLEYGPVAVDRVAGRLDEVRSVVADEERAYRAFLDALAERSHGDAIVLDMFPSRSEPPGLHEG